MSMNRPFLFCWTLLQASALLVLAAPTATENRGQPIDFGDGFGAETREIPPNTNSQTVGVSVGPGFTFSPKTVTILVGDTVSWTFAESNHTVTSGPPCAVDNQYCSPSDTSCGTAVTSNPNAVYSHTFSVAGTFPYFCRIHCNFGMMGTVKVIAPSIASVTHTVDGHFIITGSSVPNSTGTLKSSPDLLTAFGNPQTITTDSIGAFLYNDASVAGATMKFYQVTF